MLSTRLCFRLTNSCSLLYEAKLANIIFSAVIRETMLLLQDGLHLDLLQWMRSPLKQPIRTKHRFFLSFLPPIPPQAIRGCGRTSSSGLCSISIFLHLFFFFFLLLANVAKMHHRLSPKNVLIDFLFPLNWV